MGRAAGKVGRMELALGPGKCTGMDARTALLEDLAHETHEMARWTGRADLSPRIAAALATVRREAFVPRHLAAAANRNGRCR